MEDAMERNSTMGLAGISTLILSGAFGLGAVWPFGTEIPRVLITALLLAANGSFMWRVARLNRNSRKHLRQTLKINDLL
jgi:hypothetical protein